MPDVGMRPARPLAHTATEQWQSFEIRMRHRRADRCVVRAQAALEAGMEEEARAALAEARTLTPDAPDLEGLRAAFEARRAAERAQLKRSRTRRALGTGAAASLLLVAGMTVWSTSRHTAPASVTTVQPQTAAVAAPGPVQGTDTTPSSLPPAAPPPVATAADTSDDSSLPTSGAVPPAEPATSTATDAVAAHAPVSPAAPVPTAGELVLPAVENASGASSPPKPPAVDTFSVQSSPAAATGADRLVSDLPAAALPVASAPPPPPIERAAAPVDDPATRPVSEEPKVRAVLAQFESAYSNLSASAARAVWPSVDERSLARAFDSLESQQVSLGACSIALSGATAVAQCDGTTTWTPRIGGGRRTQPRRWQFDLAAENGAWHIVRATAR